MTLKRNTLENGVASGGAVNIGNSDNTGGDAFSVLNVGSGGTCTYDDAVFAYGGMSARFDNATTGNPSIMGFAETASTQFTASVMFRVSDLVPLTSQFGWRAQTSAPGQSVKCFLNNGVMTIVNGSGTTLATATTAISINTWYRWNFWCSGLNGSSGDFRSAIYALGSSTPIDSVTVTGVTTTTDVAEVRFGKNAAAIVGTFWFDEPRVDIGSATQLPDLTADASPAAAVAAAVGAANNAGVLVATVASAEPAMASGVANGATFSGSLSATVNAQVALAAASAPFDPSGASQGLDYLVSNFLEVAADAFDASVRVGANAQVASVSAVANNLIPGGQQNATPNAGVASVTVSANAATCTATPGVYPWDAAVFGEAFDAVVDITFNFNDASAEMAAAVGQAFDATIEAVNNRVVFFTTPTVKRRGFSRHGLWSRVSIDQGLSVLRFGDSIQTIEDPSFEQVQAADVVFIGGRTYAISEQEGDRLVEAGYGQWVRVPEAVTDME